MNTQTSLDQALVKRSEISNEIINVDESSVKLVIVEMGGEWFALPGKAIQEILSNSPLFTIPSCPTSMEGVINVRGRIESVIRLHDQLQLTYRHTDSSRIVLVQTASMNSGIRVEQVVDVVDIVESSLQAPPSTLPTHLATVVLKVFTFKNKPVALLDLPQLFADYARGLGS